MFETRNIPCNKLSEISKRQICSDVLIYQEEVEFTIWRSDICCVHIHAHPWPGDACTMAAAPTFSPIVYFQETLFGQIWRPALPHPLTRLPRLPRGEGRGGGSRTFFNIQ